MRLHFERELLSQVPPVPAPLWSCNCRNEEKKSQNLETVLTSLSQTNQSLQKRNEELTNQLLMLLIQTNNSIKMVEKEVDDIKRPKNRKERSSMCSIM